MFSVINGLLMWLLVKNKNCKRHLGDSKYWSSVRCLFFYMLESDEQLRQSRYWKCFTILEQIHNSRLLCRQHGKTFLNEIEVQIYLKGIIGIMSPIPPKNGLWPIRRQSANWTSGSLVYGCIVRMGIINKDTAYTTFGMDKIYTISIYI